MVWKPLALLPGRKLGSTSARVNELKRRQVKEENPTDTAVSNM
jgi:hypothetical protein